MAKKNVSKKAATKVKPTRSRTKATAKVKSKSNEVDQEQVDEAAEEQKNIRLENAARAADEAEAKRNEIIANKTEAFQNPEHLALTDPSALYEFNVSGKTMQEFMKDKKALSEVPPVQIVASDKTKKAIKKEVDPFPGFSKAYANRTADRFPVTLHNSSLRAVSTFREPHKIIGKIVGSHPKSPNFYKVINENGEEFFVSKQGVYIKE